MLPILLTQTIILFQDTSLVYVLSITDFLGAASKIAQRDGRLVEMYLFAALVYFIMSFCAVVLREAAAAEDRHHSLGDEPIAMPMIEIKDVSKWYGSFQVLTDCTTNVEKGEVIVVCGPSGSGKSTLIKVVNALEPFQKGEIIVDGIHGQRSEDRTCRSCARESAWCSSTSSCSRICRSPRTSTLAQIKVLSRSKDEAVARGLKLLDRVGLIAQKDKFPGQLSGGQQQRVRDRARAVDGSDLHAVRRADVGARSRDDQRGARRDGAAREGRHDDDGRHARDGLRAQGREPRDLHGSRAHRRDATQEDFFGKPRSERAQQFLAKILHH